MHSGNGFWQRGQSGIGSAMAPVSGSDDFDMARYTLWGRALQPLKVDRSTNLERYSAGNSIRAPSPPPSRFLSRTSPPCSRAMVRATLKPRPTPALPGSRAISIR